MLLSQTIKAVSSESRQVDPSRLVAPSPGKLVRYTVPDGGTLSPDQPYAEVEVCPSHLDQIGQVQPVHAAGRLPTHPCANSVTSMMAVEHVFKRSGFLDARGR